MAIIPAIHNISLTKPNATILSKSCDESALGDWFAALLLATGPFITTQSPERPLQIGSLASHFLTDLIEGLASHLHKMKAIEDDLGSRKKRLAPL